MHSPIERETSHLKAHWGKDQDAPQCSLKKYILHFTAPTKQAHKLGRCDSYLRNLKLSLTHWLTHDWQEKVLGGAIPSKKCTLGIVWCIGGAVPSFQFIVKCRSLLSSVEVNQFCFFFFSFQCSLLCGGMCCTLHCPVHHIEWFCETWARFNIFDRLPLQLLHFWSTVLYRVFF